MQGHEPIIAMRLQGKKPALVYLDMLRDYSPMKAWADWPGVSPAIPTVWVQDSDTPSRLDLRFLVGLTAVITGTDGERIRQLTQAALDAGAARVVAAHVESYADRGEMRFRTIHVADSGA